MTFYHDDDDNHKVNLITIVAICSGRLSRIYYCNKYKQKWCVKSHIQHPTFGGLIGRGFVFYCLPHLFACLRQLYAKKKIYLDLNFFHDNNNYNKTQIVAYLYMRRLISHNLPHIRGGQMNLTILIKLNFFLWLYA